MSRLPQPILTTIKVALRAIGMLAACFVVLSVWLTLDAITHMDDLPLTPQCVQATQCVQVDECIKGIHQYCTATGDEGVKL
jgi:hypothetical protein